jgi:hypothetical protein
MKNLATQSLRLAGAARAIARKHQERIQELKNAAREQERPDWLWHALLVSFATMGNSRGYDGLIRNWENYDRVKYDTLRGLTKEARRRQLRETLHAAKVRMPDRKADWLNENFEMIEAEMGGVEAAKREALGQQGRDAKIKFLQLFEGIGDKYSRNIWMDVYHPDFRESIAIDERIKAISSALGLSFRNY